jgi:hypothetical protein
MAELVSPNRLSLVVSFRGTLCLLYCYIQIYIESLYFVICGSPKRCRASPHLRLPFKILFCLQSKRILLARLPVLCACAFALAFACTGILRQRSGQEISLAETVKNAASSGLKPSALHILSSKNIGKTVPNSKVFSATASQHKLAVGKLMAGKHALRAVQIQNKIPLSNVIKVRSADPVQNSKIQKLVSSSERQGPHENKPEPVSHESDEKVKEGAYLIRCMPLLCPCVLPLKLGGASETMTSS